MFNFVDTTLSYTSLFLKRETEKWNDQGNQIVKVTKEMAAKLYYMAQYLKKKGPIQVRSFESFLLHKGYVPILTQVCFTEQRCFCDICKRSRLKRPVNHPVCACHSRPLSGQALHRGALCHCRTDSDHFQPTFHHFKVRDNQ